MIYVNGRVLSQPLTGVQRFARELLRELLQIRDNVRILAPTNAENLGPLGPYMKTTGSHHDIRWEQLDLAAEMRRRGSKSRQLGAYFVYQSARSDPRRRFSVLPERIRSLIPLMVSNAHTLFQHELPEKS